MAPEAPISTRFTADGRYSEPGRPYVAPKTGLNAPTPNLASGGRYKLGTPYKQGGVWYIPAEQPNYDEVGLASWYGDAFNAKTTANGEMFDMNALSAAHATLPMPCIVEVTNLENGRALNVRLNDRGPYHPGRIIDLSHAAAVQLGYDIKGTTRVRVRYVGPAPLDAAPIDAPVTIAAGSRVADFTRQRPTAAYQMDLPPLAERPIGAFANAYSVQAGAFSSLQTAEHVAAQLAPAGRASIHPLARGGSTLYRVVVGPLSDSGSAATTRSQIAALGFTDARITFSGF